MPLSLPVGLDLKEQWTHILLLEVRPVCSRCTLSAAECNYAITLVWEDDSVSAGKSHGRAGTWSKAQADGQTSRYSNGQSLPPPTQSQQFLYGTCAGAFLNTTASDIQNWLSQTQNSGRQWASIPAQIASAAVKIGHSASSASCFSSLCDNISLRSVGTDKMLLDYYHSVVSVDETLVRPDDENDPRQYIFLQALSSPAVALGILMVTAHLWSQTDANISALASEYRKLVLEVVKKSSDPGDMMLLAVMLCSMEVRIDDAGPNDYLADFLTRSSLLVNAGQCGWSILHSSETSYKSDKVYQKPATSMTTSTGFVAGTWCVILSSPKPCFLLKRYLSSTCLLGHRNQIPLNGHRHRIAH